MEKDGYKEAVREFYKVYRLIQKKYNLRLHAHFSIYEDGIIEIERTGRRKSKVVIRVTDPDDIQCYRKAAGELGTYDRWQQAKEEKNGLHEGGSVKEAKKDRCICYQRGRREKKRIRL